jgi:hypothetical protein
MSFGGEVVGGFTTEARWHGWNFEIGGVRVASFESKTRKAAHHKSTIPDRQPSMVLDQFFETTSHPKKKPLRLRGVKSFDPER